MKKKPFLGSYIYTKKSLDEKLAVAQKYFLSKELSYEEVGFANKEFPLGYNHDHYYLDLGKGKTDFDNAVKGFKAWVAHKHSGLVPSPVDAKWESNTTVYFGFILGPVVIGFPDRITEVNQDDKKFECIYGTIEGHSEKGEEIFRITHDDDDIVRMYIGCYSKIVAPLAIIGYPVARYLQKRVSRKYMTSLRSYVRENR